MLKRLLFIGAFLMASFGYASAQGLTTITVLDSASATKTYRVVQDSSNRFSSTTSLCDPTTGALAAANCVTVSSGAALVTGTGGTFPATQSGTWTMQPGNTANTTAWLVTGTGGTFPATQSGTWTVQPGNTANSTPWLVTAASATAPVSTMNSASAGAGLNSALAGVFDDTSPTAITENSFGFLRMSANRNLYGTIRDAAGNERGANVNSSNQLSVSVDGGSVFNANGIAAASASSPFVQAYDQVNSTTGNIAANNTTAVVVNAAATTLYGVQVFGLGSAPAYLKLYNATSATCGSGTPVKRIMIPAASTAANGAGAVIPFHGGLRFSTGLTYCITTGIGDADTTAPAASTFLANLDWR